MKVRYSLRALLQLEEIHGYIAEHNPWAATAVIARVSVHTNMVEGYFSIYMRGMMGVYQHCSEKRLRRYLAEFYFRYNARTILGIDDETRTTKALGGIKGKRLKYRDSSQQTVVRSSHE